MRKFCRSGGVIATPTDADYPQCCKKTQPVGAAITPPGLRIFACLIIIALVLAACGTPSIDDVEPTEPYFTPPAHEQLDHLVLPFAQRDVLNPFFASTEVNLLLAPLMWEALFAADETHYPQPVLAESFEQPTPTQLLITLREREFHNGNAVTAADVVYSFGRAQASTNFSARLSNVTAMRVRDDLVEVNLRHGDVFAAANLDFPIVPANSAGTAPLRQSVGGYHFTLENTPVGTGLYYLAQDDDGAFTLAHHTGHPAAAPALTTIHLHGVSQAAALLHGVEVGSYHFAYDDLTSGDLPAVAAASHRVSTTNLVFLGMNSRRGALQQADARAAIAGALDITRVMHDGFAAFAQPTHSPFPRSWHAMQGEEFTRGFNATQARQAIDAAGLVNPSFDLVVYRYNPAMVNAAGSLRAQLQAVGVEINLVVLDRAAYETAVRNGNFDLYLGQIRLTPGFSLAPLLSYGGAATVGINVWGDAANAYTQLRLGELTPAEFYDAFWDDVPFVPLGYRMGMVAAARGLNMPAALQRGNLFADISAWLF
ncbi:MAG: ABC transporter substrate-binding protein [Oscillospiraceae bacterium]|nr:ABC transporter substrate-binding protein [Oscillospiraceae bacterium]